MEPTVWLVGLAGGMLVIAVLLVIAIGRLATLARYAGDNQALVSRLDTLVDQNVRLERELRAELAQGRSEAAQHAQTARGELSANLGQVALAMQTQLAQAATTQNERLTTLTQSNEQRLEAVRATVEQKLDALRAENAQKLEQMRVTVDEKLHATLEQRLGESFKLVSDRLELVHRGLGEMQTLASGVGDLKKVLTNIKTRGTWGEVQLENLLEQILTPAQYEKNVATRPGSRERVEFAIRLPGRSEDREPVWLPIDAKFPLEDFQRLQDAQERADLVGVESFGKALEDRIRKQAKDIHDKYVQPPYTTDFAFLYLPVESLYAEVLRRPGLADTIQREYQITPAGPTTLAAMLNSLQMGFRTLAIEQRSGEVWKVLGAVKQEFGKFGDLLDKAKKQIDAVSNSLDAAGVRTRAIERNLRGVEALPEAEAARLIGSDNPALIDLDPSADAAVEDPDDEAGDAGMTR